MMTKINNWYNSPITWKSSTRLAMIILGIYGIFAGVYYLYTYFDSVAEKTKEIGQRITNWFEKKTNQLKKIF